MGSVDDESLATSNETHQTDPQLAPPWEQPASDTSDAQRVPPFTPWRFWLASRSQQVGLAAIVGILILAALLGRILLGDIFPSDTPDTGTITPTTGRVAHVVAPSTVAAPTPVPTSVPSPTVAPVRNTPAPAFSIAFTCASGVIFGRGMVCIHTRPDAAVSLSVRYCDGSYAGGKDLRGNAHADGSGNYTWRWIVITSCAGKATATVTAKSSGQTVTKSTTFIVTR